MSKPVTMSFIATADLKALLEQWAKAEDRTVSATLRRILEAEALRRNRQATRQEATYRAN
jgi:hypothetical protein